MFFPLVPVTPSGEPWRGGGWRRTRTPLLQSRGCLQQPGALELALGARVGVGEVVLRLPTLSRPVSCI